METRKKAVLILLIIGLILFGAVQGIVLPRVAQSRQQDMEKQQEPLTHDFESISKYKSKYMGDASNLGNLFHSLPLSDVEMTFELYPETLTADINYKKVIAEIGMDRVQKALIYNATAAFTLIDNLEAVRFNFPEVSYKVLRSEVEGWYGVSLKALAEKSVWNKEVQSKFNEDSYVQSCLKSIVKEVQKRTPLEEAIMLCYGNTDDPVVIYEQTPFEGGTLVLAEKLTDGEHYPDLYFLDANNKVAYLTQSSYCWTLNYTQFMGHNIYFGLAGPESHNYSGAPASVKKIEALFSGKTFSVVPRDGIIAHINLPEKDTREFKNPQGYIMPVEDRAMPEKYTAIFENGKKLSLSQKVIRMGIEDMPDYLDSKRAEIYNSYAFTYTPMLTPLEWEKGYKEGQTCLEGKTDHRGNRNALCLRPAGHMSFADSFILPHDIKPLYLSNNYPRTAGFSAGETVAVKYPEKRKLLDCRILMLTRQKVEKEIGQDGFTVVDANEKEQITLPKEKGYYLFLLRTVENEDIQTYTGMLEIK